MSIYRVLFSSFKVERKIAVVTILFKKIFIGKQYNEGHPKNQILLFSELSVEGVIFYKKFFSYPPINTKPSNKFRLTCNRQKH